MSAEVVTFVGTHRMYVACSPTEARDVRGAAQKIGLPDETLTRYCTMPPRNYMALWLYKSLAVRSPRTLYRDALTILETLKAAGSLDAVLELDELDPSGRASLAAVRAALDGA